MTRSLELDNEFIFVTCDEEIILFVLLISIAITSKITKAITASPRNYVFSFFAPGLVPSTAEPDQIFFATGGVVS